jgi:signal recognition particle subunit SRP68
VTRILHSPLQTNPHALAGFTTDVTTAAAMDITHFVASHREALLIGDYNSYRSQLSRQLLATRRRLGRATNKREKFAARPVTIEDISNNHEFVHLLLLTSERAWAHAMHIKTSHTDDVSGKGIWWSS